MLLFKDLRITQRLHLAASGFTMVELMIVLALAAILTIIAVPSFVSYLQLNRLTGTTESLYYRLQYARGEAIKRNTSVYVSFTPGNNWCYGLNTDSACTCTNPASCSLGVVTPPSSTQTSLSTSGLTSNTLQFENTHGATYVTGTITFTVYGQTSAMAVKVTPLGNLLICSNNVSGYQACT